MAQGVRDEATFEALTDAHLIVALYRPNLQALITAAVTGQFDIPEEAT